MHPDPDFGPCADRIDEERLRDILCRAFGISPPAKWDRFFARVGMDQVRVQRFDGVVQAGLALYRFGMFFGGRSVPCAGVAAVGAAPERRGAGLTRRLLENTLRELYVAGVPLSALFPSTQALYRKVGFESAGHRVSWSVPLQAIGVRERPLAIREVDPRDPDLFREIYRQRAEASAGNLDRSPAIWERVTQGGGEIPIFAYRIGVEAAPEGYVIFEHASTEGPKYDLLVRDWVALTPAAGRTLWSFLAGHRSLGERAKWHGPASEPMVTLLPEQPTEAERPFRWMVRMVDVPRALEARGYPAGLNADLHLYVRDDLLPANQGRLRLRVADGRGTVSKEGSGDVQMDVRGLAPLYTGLMTPAQLRSIGLVEGPPDALAAAARVFAGPEPWMSEIF